MHLPTALALAGGAGLATAHPLSLFSRGVATFAAGTSWDILLNKGDTVGNVKQVVKENFQVIDIDLFDTDKATINDLKATKQIICYFSAGSKEGWRPDAGDFKDGDTGKGLDGWPDENWVNVKSENVRNIMKKRIKLAADNGCTAIDPDNVDGFDGNQDGYGYDKKEYADYVKFMAQEAANNNLAIGLKNAVDLIPDVVDVIQFAVNEQCHEYPGECEKYKPLTDANKAVFNIEYGGKNCNSPAGVKLSTLIKPEDQGLNTLGGACSGSTAETPTNGANNQAPSQTQGSDDESTAAPTQNSNAARPTPTSSDDDNTPSFTRGVSRPTPISESEEEEEEVEKEDDGNEPASTLTSRASRTHHWGSHRTGFPSPSSGFPHRPANASLPHPTGVSNPFGNRPAAPTPTSTGDVDENEENTEEGEENIEDNENSEDEEEDEI